MTEEKYENAKWVLDDEEEVEFGAENSADLAERSAMGIEIEGKIYRDGDSVRTVSKNYIICSFYYDVQFYGYTEAGESIFKHFLTVRMLFSKFKWTFRTKYLYNLPFES